MALPDTSIIAKLEPISTLSENRLQELANLCFIEKVNKNLDPFRMNVVKNAQSLYLLKGDLGVLLNDGTKQVLKGGTEATMHPIDPERLSIKDAIALTDIEIVRIDLDLLDIMMTWDQLAGVDHSKQNMTASSTTSRTTDQWMHDTGVFAAGKLQSGVFSRLPPANIKEMFRRMTPVDVTAGQIIIRQGAEGDYFYLIEEGLACVSRVSSPNEKPVVLAELSNSESFGEEALVSDNKRNATVTMKTDGRLLKLNKQDFIELLKEPLLNQIPFKEASANVGKGAIWLDVRLPSEYKFDHFKDAINLPLTQIRSQLNLLDASKQYITYCQTGRRSSAAAFILVQNGIDALVLQHGMRDIKL